MFKAGQGIGGGFDSNEDFPEVPLASMELASLRSRLTKLMLAISVQDVGDFEPLRCYWILAQSGMHRREEDFVAEGEILLSQEWFERLQAQTEKRLEAIAVCLLDKPGIEALTGRTCYQSLKAVGKAPRLWTVDELLDERRFPMRVCGGEGDQQCRRPRGADPLAVLLWERM
ncbi:MAG: hypothetical protein M2R45_04543 [Verrucomicrobia subdivision 3 bacterium]|nr:hypothetical protein [Limisphaerales bacterium]MCS1416818.1 hypothetical protein [Limisphaerales bacterium]